MAHYSKVVTLCNSLERVYAFGMNERVVTIDRLKDETRFVTEAGVLPDLTEDVELLADKTVARLNEMLLLADETLVAARALHGQQIIETATDR
jgi:hypothetical protein